MRQPLHGWQQYISTDDDIYEVLPQYEDVLLYIYTGIIHGMTAYLHMVSTLEICCVILKIKNDACTLS